MKKLIAEDEMQYRITLENRKHEVLITHDGEECLKSYRDADDKFVYEQQQSADPKTFNDDTNNPPLMELSQIIECQKKDGMEVAKEILALNPHERVIFASADIQESVADMIKQLNQVGELMQKPFEHIILGTYENNLW